MCTRNRINYTAYILFGQTLTLSNANGSTTHHAYNSQKCAHLQLQLKSLTTAATLIIQPKAPAQSSVCMRTYLKLSSYNACFQPNPLYAPSYCCLLLLLQPPFSTAHALPLDLLLQHASSSSSTTVCSTLELLTHFLLRCLLLASMLRCLTWRAHFRTLPQFLQHERPRCVALVPHTGLCVCVFACVCVCLRVCVCVCVCACCISAWTCV